LPGVFKLPAFLSILQKNFGLNINMPGKPYLFINKLFLFAFFFFACCFATEAQQFITPVQDSALFEILNLRTKTARKILDSEKGKKFDIYNEYLYNWSEAIELTLAGDEIKYKKYQTSLEQRLERIEKMSNKTEAMYGIVLADIYTHAAMVNLMYGDYLTGFAKLMKANKNARSNETMFPRCWLNNKLSGALNVSFASISPFWRKIAGIFSLNGDEKNGFDQLNRYLNSVKGYPGLHSEAVLYYGAVLKIAKNEQQALELMNKQVIKEKAPVLAIFLASNILFFNNRSEDAIKYLNTIPLNKIEVPFYHYDYLLGKEKLTRIDPDTYIVLNRYLNTSKLKNYNHEITMKLAHFYFMQGNINEYQLLLKKMDDFPRPIIERDREAMVERELNYLPDIDLLKSRYLVAGGYYQRAKSLLEKRDIQSFKVQAQKNEYKFLLATVQNSEKQTANALAICDELIRSGENDKDQFPGESAILAGNICLQTNEIKRAEYYFNKALEIDGNDDVYIEIIHRKAKNQLQKLQSTD
jgi:hypothetical protein